MIAKLLTVVTPGHPDTRIYECNHCGTKVEHPWEPCPNCEHSRIVVYDL